MQPSRDEAGGTGWGTRGKVYEINDQVAVVTGAAQGNGRAIALGLARAGARIACCDVQIEALRSVVEEVSRAGGAARAIPLDVTDGDRCVEVAAEVKQALGPAAILVNNAGIIRRTPPDAETFAEDWDRVMAVNATGVM